MTIMMMIMIMIDMMMMMMMMILMMFMGTMMKMVRRALMNDDGKDSASVNEIWQCGLGSQKLHNGKKETF